MISDGETGLQGQGESGFLPGLSLVARLYGDSPQFTLDYDHGLSSVWLTCGCTPIGLGEELYE